MSTPVNYNVVIKIDPIVITGGTTAKVKAAQSVARWAQNSLTRMLNWYLSGGRGGVFPDTTYPGVQVLAQKLGADGKVEKTAEIPGMSVKSKVAEMKIKEREKADAETFDMDAFLSG